MPAALDPDHASDSVAHSFPDAVSGPNVPPEVVTAERRGQILLQRTILKSDYFPGTSTGWMCNGWLLETVVLVDEG